MKLTESNVFRAKALGYTVEQLKEQWDEICRIRQKFDLRIDTAERTATVAIQILLLPENNPDRCVEPLMWALAVEGWYASKFNAWHELELKPEVQSKLRQHLR